MFSFPDQEEQKILLISTDSIFEKIYSFHPNVLCFARGTNSLSVLIGPIVVLLSLLLLGYTCIIYLYVSVKRNHTSATTLRLQLMLFWSLLYQSLFLMIFAIIPSLICFVCVIMGTRNVPIMTIFVFVLFLMHTPIDCLLILYTIKPYRNFLVNKILTWRTQELSELSLSVHNIRVQSLTIHQLK